MQNAIPGQPSSAVYYPACRQRLCAICSCTVSAQQSAKSGGIAAHMKPYNLLQFAVPSKRQHLVDFTANKITGAIKNDRGTRLSTPVCFTPVDSSIMTPGNIFTAEFTTAAVASHLVRPSEPSAAATPGELLPASPAYCQEFVT
jgi:hypothetical protein